MPVFRRRTRGTVNQIGKAFPIFDKKKLPKLIVPVRHASIPPTLKKVIDIPLQKLVPREAEPTDLERRTNPYIERYKAGIPLPPIWVEPLGGSRFRIWDGHARYRAAKFLGLKSLQATVMSKAQLETMKKHRIPKVLKA